MADVEKSQHTEQLERVKTEEDSNNSLEQVQTHETIAAVDIHNRQAFKGDESDGKISWGPRKWIAALSLAMLYTGMWLCHYNRESRSDTINCRVPSPSVLHWCHPLIHR